jgi:hypothetical protein
MTSRTESFCARSRKEEQNEVSVYTTEVSADNEAGHGRGQLAVSVLLLLLLKQTEEQFYKNMKLGFKLRSGTDRETTQF